MHSRIVKKGAEFIKTPLIIHFENTKRITEVPRIGKCPKLITIFTEENFALET